MKKAVMFGMILVLLAAAAVPVYAKGNPHGNGNGSGAGQGTSTGVNPGDQASSSIVNHGRAVNHGGRGNGNQGQMRTRTPFYLQGTISAKGTNTITVTLIHGNAQVKQYLGMDLTLQVNGNTLYYKVTQGNDTDSETEGAAPVTLSSSEDDGSRTAISFGDLAVGQKVAIHGNVVNSAYVARLVTVYLQMAVGEPTG